MKKSVLLALFIITFSCMLCSCADTPAETQWWEGVSTTQAPDTEADILPVEHLYGEWKTESGEREPIDKNTVNGSPYTVKSVSEDEYGNITATLTVDGSDVVYTVYRYKVGYSEYSYMEARFTAKDITFVFTK